MSARRVLLVGCGYVGRATASLLVGRGDRVWGLARNPRALPAGTTAIAADVLADDLAASLPEEMDAVVYLVSAGGRDDEAYRRAYVEGPRRLIEALQRRGAAPERFLFVSSTGVYGERAGGSVDETSPADATHFTGARVAEGEALVAAGPFPSIALRFGGIYGPGRERLIDAVGAGRRPGADATWTNRIHRDDGARAILHLLELTEPETVYNVTDGQPVPMGRVIDDIADLLGCPPPPLDAPASEAAERRGQGKRVLTDRLRGTGFSPLFPDHRAGYASLIEERGRA